MDRKPISGILLDKTTPDGRVYPGAETLAAFNAAVMFRPLVMCLCPQNTCNCRLPGGIFQPTLPPICGEAHRFMREGDQIIAEFMLAGTETGRQAGALLAEKTGDLVARGVGKLTESGIIWDLAIGAIGVIPRRLTNPVPAATANHRSLRDKLDASHLVWLRRVVESRRDAAINAVEYDIAEHCLRALDEG